MHFRHRHDVVVVGARAAGAATALLLARLGHDVALLDRNTLAADTLSTHQIARPGVVQLHRWGCSGPSWTAERRPSARSPSPRRVSRSLGR
jgi:2-polyprenyl-6-methoxyphenol hydroxylase-like FAD-dependent oxidoreductase